MLGSSCGRIQETYKAAPHHQGRQPVGSRSSVRSGQPKVYHQYELSGRGDQQRMQILSAVRQDRLCIRRTHLPQETA